ncbi:hypothetical protein QR680_011239 [Steinernema hermaphroditum]|uniref:Aromatic-L-amino-acid decarboxylase n=1 Tax=Steinernema hermaphroditum TaxID=289476 RepID=A0AA39IRN5_9BILA|nr:hypothetical protein QR680_011239 [Steinernema hermaphroditum]
MQLLTLFLPMCFIAVFLFSGQFKKASKGEVGRSVYLEGTRKEEKDSDFLLPVTSADFTKYMAETVAFLTDYLDNSDRYNVTTDKQPGFLSDILPQSAPLEPEKFCDIMKDLKTQIVPGPTHMQHKRFLAYYPAGCSYPDVIGCVIAAGLGVCGFTWDGCPALAELEHLMVNWLCKALNLPETFLFQGDVKDSPGGGSIQPSASDCILMSVVAARFQKIKTTITVSNESETDVLKRLVAYSSDLAHSSFQKACTLAMIRCHAVESDENFSMRGDALEKRIKEDLGNGLIPRHVQGTLGTTAMCSFDNLTEVGNVAKKYGLWFHVDASYAGSTMICPQFRFFAKGIEMADSVNVNPHKFLLQTPSKKRLKSTPPTTYTQYHEGSIDARDWGVALSRPFYGVRLWLLFRMYGSSGIQAFVRRLVSHAALFEELIKKDLRLEVVGERSLGLVCFKIRFKIRGSSKGEENALTYGFVEDVNRSHKLMMTRAELRGTQICRICTTHERSTEDDVYESRSMIQELLDEFLESRMDHISMAHGNVHL